MGLVICKRLAEAMGGKVWATSRVARGSSFYARIQVAEVDLDKSVTPQKAVSTQKADLKASKKLGETLPLKIVVAEDNRANQRVMMMMFSRFQSIHNRHLQVHKNQITWVLLQVLQ